MEWNYAYVYFIVYAFLGWICEDLYCGIPKGKFINRGFLYGPYCPIYGVGAVLVLYPLLLIGHHPAIVFIVGVIITSSLEYFTSWIMEKLFHTRWWDYSSYPLNLHGRICLKNSTLFGLMCLVLVFWVHPVIEELVHSLPLVGLAVFETVFTIGFITDMVCTIIALLRRKKVLQKMHQEALRLKTQFEQDRKEIFQEWNESFEEWLLEHPETKEGLMQVQNAFERMQELSKRHVSKAFPDRKLSKSIQELEKFGQQIQKQIQNKK